MSHPVAKLNQFPEQEGEPKAYSSPFGASAHVRCGPTTDDIIRWQPDPALVRNDLRAIDT
jgi:hypothetical protein